MRYTVTDQPEQSSYIELDETVIYGAVLTEISEPKEIKWVSDGETKTAEIIEWHWELLNPSLANPETGSPRKVKGSCNARISNGASDKFNSWVAGLTGRVPEVGEDVETDDLIGLKANVTIKKKIGKTNGAPDPTKTFDNVDNVLPWDDAPPF